MSHIIGLWPSIAAFAEDIGESQLNARAWKRRNSIPAEHWIDITVAAQKRNLDVSLQDLAEAARRRPAASRKDSPPEPPQ